MDLIRRKVKTLARKLEANGPRYTSYPTAPNWKILDSQSKRLILDYEKQSERNLSLYFHIPFCDKKCFYCGCNVVVTKQEKPIFEYVDCLIKELEHKAITLENRIVEQIHFGGGTPNYLSEIQFLKLIERIFSSFKVDPQVEMSIEVDPRTTSFRQIKFFSSLGFNRISFGVQDFDPEVQKTIGRIQSFEKVEEIFKASKEFGFSGINFDLIYGLPKQTVDGFKKTVDKVIELAPDRIALYNFAYLPKLLPYQRRFSEQDLPSSDDRLSIFMNTTEKFINHSYDFIGMDHFSLNSDELSLAQKNKTLNRNFMGYTSKSELDLIGFGVSSISEGENYFSQNEKKLNLYQDSIESSSKATEKGILLELDDKIRKWVINQLMCNLELDLNQFQQRFNLQFWEIFEEELKVLLGFEEDGIVNICENKISVSPLGRFFIRNICMIFDEYLKSSQSQVFSKTL